ncbi:MAG: response regulator transcription factor [Oleiphilaceae bacterium]|nr:response regulator transcription factor [Oleiphilaceae bacterium]
MTQALTSLSERAPSILLVDDHPLFLEGLSLVIERHFPGARVYGAYDLNQAKSFLAAQPDTDIVLLDLSLPDGRGLSLVNHMRQQQYAIPCLLLSASDDTADIELAMRSGADGFISKASGGEHIVAAVKRVLQGKEVWPEHITLAQGCDPLPNLSPRQQQVLELLAEGLPNKEICRQLSLSDHTVKTHIKALYQNLGVHNRTECLKVAIQSGLVQT